MRCDQKHTKSHRTPCLAILGLLCVFGCGSPTRDPIQGVFRRGRLCSLADAVAPVPASEIPPMRKGGASGSGVIELTWARVLYSGPKWTRMPVLVTCHSSILRGHAVRFYAKDRDVFRPLHEVCFGPGYLETPMHFEQSRRAFILLRHNSGGSASYWKHRCVYLGQPYSDDPTHCEVKGVSIESPVKALKHVFEKGQHSPPARTYIAPAAGRGLRFSFSIWNPGEFNNFPTGGRITGNLKLVLDEEGKPLRFALANWKRHPAGSEEGTQQTAAPDKNGTEQ